MMDPAEFVRLSREAYRKCGVTPVPGQFFAYLDDGTVRGDIGGACVLGAHILALDIDPEAYEDYPSCAAEVLEQDTVFIEGVMHGFDGVKDAMITFDFLGAEYENGYACGLAARKAFLEVT